MKSMAFVAAAIFAAPIAAHGQSTTLEVKVGSGGQIQMSTASPVDSTIQALSQSPAADSAAQAPAPAPVQDTTPKPFTADSLATVKKWVKTHSPIIIIDHRVTSATALNKLTFERIASFQMDSASDGDVKYYGKNANNGIITVVTNPAPPPPPPPPPSILRKRK